MHIQKIIYKGIKFDYFFLYSKDDYLGEPYDEVDRSELNSIVIGTCPYCTKKYGLYKEVGRSPESIEREIAMYDECDISDFSSTCRVEGCNNSGCDDIFIRPDECEMEEMV